MSDDFEKLKNIGAQKIHEETHIARAHVQAILHESFEEMNSVQLLGFISILEREYNLDLSELRVKAKEFFKTNTPVFESQKTVKIFTSEKTKKTKFVFYLLFVIAAMLIFYFMQTAEDKKLSKESGTEKNVATKEKVNQNVQEAAVVLKEEQNNTKQESETVLQRSDAKLSLASQTQEESDEQIIKQITAIEKSLKIIPKTKVWIGYIDLSNYKKMQTIVSDTLSLDPSKEWLLAFGHGHLDIEVGGELFHFKNPRNIRFSYINGELKEIKYEEFKSLNRGSGW